MSDRPFSHETAAAVRRYVDAFLRPAEAGDAMHDVIADATYWGETETVEVLRITHGVLQVRARFQDEAAFRTLVEDVGISPAEAVDVMGLDAPFVLEDVDREPGEDDVAAAEPASEPTTQEPTEPEPSTPDPAAPVQPAAPFEPEGEPATTPTEPDPEPIAPVTPVDPEAEPEPVQPEPVQPEPVQPEPDQPDPVTAGAPESVAEPAAAGEDLDEGVEPAPRIVAIGRAAPVAPAPAGAPAASVDEGQDEDGEAGGVLKFGFDDGDHVHAAPSPALDTVGVHDDDVDRPSRGARLAVGLLVAVLVAVLLLLLA